MLLRANFVTWAIGLWIVLFSLYPAYAADVVRDGFEVQGLSDIWNDKRAPDNRVSFQTGEAREGRQFLALEVRAEDVDEACNCQRTEISEAANMKPEFGSDVWYRFSLKILGLNDSFQTTRWVLGGWKQEVDGSPFLALRFDGGVFYITFESANTRVMLASSLIDARRFIKILKGGQAERFGFITDKDLYFGDSSIRLKHGKAVYLPDPRGGWVDLMIKVKGGLAGDGIIEIYANDQFVVRATGKIGVDAPVGSGQYLRLGHRRDRTDTDAVLLIDDYRRGPTRDSVAN